MVTKRDPARTNPGCVMATDHGRDDGPQLWPVDAKDGVQPVTAQPRCAAGEQGEKMSKAAARKALEHANTIFRMLSKPKQAEMIGEANELFCFLEKAVRELPD